MKKKLLSILLSVFMVLGCFVNVVNADEITTVEGVLATVDGDFPTSTDGAWIQIGGTNKIYKTDQGLCIVGYDSNPILLLSDTVETDASGRYFIQDETKTKSLFMFEMDDGKLKEIVLNKFDSPLDGSYAPAAKIDNTIYGNLQAAVDAVTYGDDIQTIELLNNNSETVTVSRKVNFGLDTSLFAFNGTINGGTDFNVFYNEDKSQYYVSSYKVKAATSGNGTVRLNGTESDTETYWYAVDSGFTFKNDTVNNEIRFNFNGANGGSFIATPNEGYVLDKWTYTLGGSTNDVPRTGNQIRGTNINGDITLTAVFRQKTISDILPSDFPSAEGNVIPNNAWENSDESLIYVQDGTKLHLFSYEQYEEGEHEGDYKECDIGTNTSLAIDGDKYTCTVDTITYEFNMSDDKPVSIKVSGFTSDLAIFNGEYKVPKNTIADILPEGFPTSLETGWISEKDAKIYLNTTTTPSQLETSLSGGEKLAILANERTQKGANQYSYTYGSIETGEFYTVLFHVTDSVVSSIEVINYDETALNGTYVAPTLKTIADILPADFPTTSTSGWVDGSVSYKMYHDDNKLKLYMNPSVTVILSDNTVLTKDGNNYTYTLTESPYYTLVFKMDGNNLQAIDIAVSGTTYYTLEPYKYTSVPTSKPEGYTGELEFVTSAVYTNDNDVTVQVDDSTLTLNEEYTLSHGSTHVKLKGDYVKTLAAGTHTITIGVTGYDDIDANFTITGSSPSPTPGYKIPNTGVEGAPTNNHSLLKLSSLSLLVVGTYIAIKKKKKD